MSPRAKRTKKNPQSDEVRRLSTLHELSEMLALNLKFEESLSRLVGILEKNPTVRSCRVTLSQTPTGSSLVISSDQPNRKEEVGLDAGAEITQRVISFGKPVVVPRTSLEPMYKGRHSRPKDGEERSFLSVPVLLDAKSVGAFSVELNYEEDRSYERAMMFFQVVTSMIEQAMKISRLAEAEKQTLAQENLHLREELKERYDFSNIIGNSSGIRQVYEQVTQVARSNTTVLIRGESGTGKELIAHAIHYNSLRAHKPFIRVSCATLPETLIESELFGYEKGAFTGAHKRKQGRFEMADGGTLFLDEIGDLDLALQVKLLRVLQEREFERLGGNKTIRVNVRLIVATNRDLEEAIADKEFREDLFYRLNVFSIFVPPLRERKSDILLLADHFLEKYVGEHKKPIRRISTPAIDMLVSYHWPGNVRELENAIERAVLVAEGPVIHGYHLPPTLQTAEASGTQMSVSLSDAVMSYEKDLLQDALKSTRGNRAKAARLLGTSERIIGYKVTKYEIDCSRFR